MPSSVGTFTIPGYALSALPAGDNGYFNFAPVTPEVSFTATGLVLGAVETQLPGTSFGAFTLK